MTDVKRFYDELSEHYHLPFADWDGAVARQGESLDRLVKSLIGPGPKRVLDAARGVRHAGHRLSVAPRLRKEQPTPRSPKSVTVHETGATPAGVPACRGAGPESASDLSLRRKYQAKPDEKS